MIRSPSNIIIWSIMWRCVFSYILHLVLECYPITWLPIHHANSSQTLGHSQASPMKLFKCSYISTYSVHVVHTLTKELQSSRAMLSSCILSQPITCLGLWPNTTVYRSSSIARTFSSTFLLSDVLIAANWFAISSLSLCTCSSSCTSNWYLNRQVHAQWRASTSGVISTGDMVILVMHQWGI